MRKVSGTTPVVAAGVTSLKLGPISGKIRSIRAKYSGTPAGTQTLNINHGATGDELIMNIAAFDGGFFPRRAGEGPTGTDVTNGEIEYDADSHVTFAVSGGTNGQTVAVAVFYEDD